MPALPSSVIDRCGASSPRFFPNARTSTRLGCHRSRIPHRVTFDKFVQVLGAASERIADATCSATTIRNCDEWITAGVFEQLERLCLEA